MERVIRKFDSVGLRDRDGVFGLVTKMVGDSVVVKWFLTGMVETVNLSDVRWVGRKSVYGT